MIKLSCTRPREHGSVANKHLQALSLERNSRLPKFGQGVRTHGEHATLVYC